MESIAFHVEYGWNGITKMAGISPKTYSISMWNGWNPPRIIWIPYGFLVECGGRVKTSFFIRIYCFVLASYTACLNSRNQQIKTAHSILLFHANVKLHIL